MREADRLALVLLGLIAFLSLWSFTGSIGMAFVSSLFIGGPKSWLVLIPFTCLWLSPALRERPSRWLSVWMLTVPLAILAAPGWGLPLVAASLLPAAQIVLVLRKQRDPRVWRMPALAAGALAGVMLLTPVASMLVGALRYVMEQAGINQVAYGLTWPVSWSRLRSWPRMRRIWISPIATPTTSTWIGSRLCRSLLPIISPPYSSAGPSGRWPRPFRPWC